MTFKKNLTVWQDKYLFYSKQNSKDNNMVANLEFTYMTIVNAGIQPCQWTIYMTIENPGNFCLNQDCENINTITVILAMHTSNHYFQ